MNLYRHVFNSWLLSVSITLGVFFVYKMIANDTYRHLHLDSVASIPFVFGFFIIALPSLLIAFVFFRYVCSMRLAINERFFLWCFFGLAAIVLNVFAIPLILLPDLID